ncbi:MAG: hypothetical protein WB646_14780, partial [Steroidobacteraceae bacterium]
MKINAVRLAAGAAWVCLLVAFLGAYALIASYLYVVPSLPPIDAMGTLNLPVPMRVYSRSGQLIAQIGEKRRVLVAYADIPET